MRAGRVPRETKSGRGARENIVASAAEGYEGGEMIGMAAVFALGSSLILLVWAAACLIMDMRGMSFRKDRK